MKKALIILLSFLMAGCVTLGEPKKKTSIDDIRKQTQESLDSKITALSADTSPDSADIGYSIDDPTGTPASKKATWGNIITKAHGIGNGMVGVATGIMGTAVAGTDYLAPWGSSSEVTISSGIAALSSIGYYTIDTEDDGATDDLTQITGLADGDEIIISPNNDARTVVVKNGANMILCRGADFTMNNTKDRMVLQHIGSNVMVEISRSSGGD